MDILEHICPEFLLGEHTRNVEHRGLRVVKQCEQAVSENIFEPWPPAVLKHAFYNAYKL
jgi:hypothetical protein